jgi:NADPH-dependent curcumin reductase CurA
MKLRVLKPLRKFTALAIFGAILSKNMKMNKPQQRQAVALMEKIMKSTGTIVVGKADRKFITTKLREFVIQFSKDIEKGFPTLFSKLRQPALYIKARISYYSLTYILHQVGRGTK